MTYFSMLATDWVYDSNNKNSQVRLRPKTLWDDMLSRHQRECDDLVRLEQKHNRLKRVASTETVRESLTGGDMASTSGENIPGYSQQVLQKKRRIDSAQESKKSISSTTSSISAISDPLSVPSIAVREQELVASTSRDMHSHSHSHEGVLSREAYSFRSLRPRKSSDSHLSSASESSFSDISTISGTSDWDLLEDESIGQFLNVEDIPASTI